MCDTIVVVRDDRVLFGKNSDRDANEGQNLVWSPARSNERGARVRCTYIDIPEVRETFAVLLSQPFWLWGAETGANEHGVTIGNEAVFTTEPYAAEPALLGMDLLRLGLERAATAQQAVEAIVELLETHGQGGPCGHESPGVTYHNSFIVADPREAYVLETAGARWVTERVGSGARSISNALTIPGFRERFGDAAETALMDGEARQCRTSALAADAASVSDVLRLLQDHGEERTEPVYERSNGAMSAPCVHAGGERTACQTTASWAAELRPGGGAHWAAATAAPCLSLYKPVAVGDPVAYRHARDVADDSHWWRHERLHRAVMRNPRVLRPLFIDERDSVQRSWLESPPGSAAAFAECDRLTERWTRRVSGASAPDARPDFVRRYWEVRDARARRLSAAS